MNVRKQIRDKYAASYPLLAAYDAVVAEHSEPQVSINEPWTGGIEERAAMEIALTRIGRPARDTQDIDHALAYVASLNADYRAELDLEPTIRELVIDEFFPYGGCVPTAESWLSDDYDDEDRDGILDDLVATIHSSLPTETLNHLLRELLEYAMAPILAHITAEDEERRATRRRPVKMDEAGIFAVREANPIADVIGERVTLRPADDGTLVGACPFHGDPADSFTVHTGLGAFRCVHCGTGGDVVAFVMLTEGLGFAEAVQRLATRGGVQLSGEDRHGE